MATPVENLYDKSRQVWSTDRKNIRVCSNSHNSENNRSSFSNRQGVYPRLFVGWSTPKHT